MVTKQLTTAEQVRLFWPMLSDEDKTALGIKRWLRYGIFLGGEGPNHGGNITLTAVFLFPETVSADDPEADENPEQEVNWRVVHEGESRRLELPTALVVQVLGFGIQHDQAVADAVLELFGEMPDLSIS